MTANLRRFQVISDENAGKNEFFKKKMADAKGARQVGGALGRPAPA